MQRTAAPQTSALADRVDTRLLAFLAVLVAAWRILLCAQAPHDTADVLRHLYTALEVGRDGLASLAEPLSKLYPSLSPTVPWADFAYNYPIGAVAFFRLVTEICPSVFAAKLSLTAIEALNSIIVWRITGSRLAGLAYWASPLSLWWVSHEAQFEPVQTLALLLAWWQLPRSSWLAGALLAAAVQVKLTAILLVPLFVVKSWETGRIAGCVQFLLGFAVATIPTLIAASQYPMASQVLSTSKWPIRFNPWHWAIPPFTKAWWMPVAYVGTVKVALVSAAGVILAAAWRLRQSVALLSLAAPLALLGLAAVAGVFQPWYWLVFVSFLPTISGHRTVLTLCVLLVLIEPWCLWQLLLRPVGPNNYPSSVPVTAHLHLP